jgi:hypothetical protein
VILEEEGRVPTPIFSDLSESIRGVRDRKLNNADSGCLASHLLRRTYIATKCAGELLRSFDPTVSEWGNPPSIAGDLHTKFFFERRSY